LLAFEPVSIGSWSEWKNAWRNATTYEEMSGLLHCGFDVPIVPFGAGVAARQNDAWADRICFYLELADNFNTTDSAFARESEQSQSAAHGDPIRSMGALRRQLAWKAFKVLTQNFFLDSARDRDDEPSWLRSLLLEGVLEKVIWFFRLDANDRIPNLRAYSVHPKVPVERAFAFAAELCELGWKSRQSRYRLTTYGYARFEAVQPQLLDLMLGLGKITQLLNYDEYPLDERCWERLEELALGPRNMRIPDGSFSTERRTPKSAEEAAINGSVAATVFIALSAIRQEETRFATLVEARRAAAKAQRELAELEASAQ
jgi:hypothetical protein